MKTKKIIPLVILILMILGITGISIFSFNAREKDNYSNQTTSNEEMQEKNTKGNSETKDDEKKEEDKSSSDNQKNTNSGDNQKSDANPKIDTTPKISNDNTVSDNSTNNNSISKNNTTPKATEEPKQLTEWEKLGISEYDYYNSPREGQSDMTLDFKTSEYGSSDNAYNACLEAGSNYTGLKDYRFRCYDIYSYSGDILGYHIKYFELQS